ncbi:MAG: hypothetical protein KDJ82_12200 [Rhodobacteraceae bacterium]|nr:hypothetical protein [Paracoccaceae bacterium]
MISPVATIGTVLSGVMLFMLLPLLARAGSRPMFLLLFVLSMPFCFAVGRGLANLAGAVIWLDWVPAGPVWAGGLPVRAADGVVFALFTALAVTMTFVVRKARP